jgi:hypothetical protein
MRRLALGALAWVSTMVAAACTAGQPMQDPPAADIDAAWLYSGGGDAGGPTPDAVVRPGSDAADAAAADAPGLIDVAPSPADAAQGDTGSTGAPETGPPPPCTLTSCGTREVCTGGQCVLARRVFVSSSTSNGDLGGYAGADSTCQSLAHAAGLGGVWAAWISDNASSPSMRFTQANYEYALLDGTVVASDWTALTSGALAHGIDEDEHGQPVGGGTTEVWTATATDGTLFADGCNSFSTGSSNATTVEVGVSGNTDATWTEVYLQFCDRSDHMYCVEQ